MRDGQVPAVPDRHEAKAEAQNPAGQRGNAIGETEQIADDDNGCADQGCDGVEIGTQNMRNLSEENVARHTAADTGQHAEEGRSEEHTSELQSLMRISYAVFCLKKKTKNKINKVTHQISQ